ncbi:MAG: hypothetical protein AB7F59_11825 [Bdellovibrionales bacterium]
MFKKVVYGSRAVRLILSVLVAMIYFSEVFAQVDSSGNYVRKHKLDTDQTIVYTVSPTGEMQITYEVGSNKTPLYKGVVDSVVVNDRTVTHEIPAFVKTRFIDTIPFQSMGSFGVVVIRGLPFLIVNESRFVSLPRDLTSRLPRIEVTEIIHSSPASDVKSSRAVSVFLFKEEIMKGKKLLHAYFVREGDGVMVPRTFNAQDFDSARMPYKYFLIQEDGTVGLRAADHKIRTGTSENPFITIESLSQERRDVTAEAKVLGTLPTDVPREEFELSSSLEGSSVRSDLAELVQSQKASFVDATTQLNATPVKNSSYLRWLLKNVIGQKEAIRNLVNAYQRQSNLGVRENRNIFLMGMPGTGKDTIAKAHVDAVNGRDGAHVDDLFHVPVVKNQANLGAFLGSETGYVGSAEIPGLVRFVVTHSGGEYLLRWNEGAGPGEQPWSVHKNPDWKPGMVIEGYKDPAKSAVYVNEFHDWTTEGSNAFLKRFLELGIVPLRSPGQSSVNELVYRGEKFIASNDGIELISSLQADGSRFGDPMPYERMFAQYQKVFENKTLLKDMLRRSKDREGNARVSPETLNRVYDDDMILLAPLSPRDLQRIVRLNLRRALREIVQAPVNANKFYQTEFVVTRELIQYIQSFQYEAEEMARPLDNRIKSLFLNALSDALAKKLILPSAEERTITFSVRVNADGTSTLLINEVSGTGPAIVSSSAKQSEVLIRGSLKLKEKQPITPERIAELRAMVPELQKQVFGATGVIEALGRAILDQEDPGRGNLHGKAKVLMFLGLTSVGKTELARALGRVLLNDPDAVFKIDFNHVKDEQAAKQVLYGSKEGKEIIKSIFAKAFDQGRRIFLLDEFVNAYPGIEGYLFEFLRDRHASFIDGNRSMEECLFILTGNLGTKNYESVPLTVPLEERMAAYEEIYRLASQDEAGKRAVLNGRFGAAFLARVGMDNIYFFGPHTFKSVRELTQSKVMGALESLKWDKGILGWDVRFASQQDFIKLVEMVESEGFRIEEQGASIGNYVDDHFRKRLRDILRGVPNKAQVALRYKGTQEVKEPRQEKTVLKTEFEVLRAGEPSLTFSSLGKTIEKEAVRPPMALVKTAYHEAGHEVVRRVLFGDKQKSIRITIIPSVVKIRDEWIHAAGFARHEEVEQVGVNREVVVREMATLLAGGVAESIVIDGDVIGAGKQNDIDRATEIARKAVISWGLSQGLGNIVVTNHDGKKVIDASLIPEAEKQKIFNEVRALLQEAEGLARRVLVANSEQIFLPLGNLLAEKGNLVAEQLEEFYKGKKLIPVESVRSAPETSSAASSILQSIVSWWKGTPTSRSAAAQTLDSKLKANVPPPSQVADIAEIVAGLKKAQIDQVSLPSNIPLAEGFTKKASVEAPIVKAAVPSTTSISPASSARFCGSVLKTASFE